MTCDHPINCIVIRDLDIKVTRNDIRDPCGNAMVIGKPEFYPMATLTCTKCGATFNKSIPFEQIETTKIDWL